tara:strand:- start:2050 stop:2232 length:183 start_codon:yes stop_codon:yes gene_type:complete
MIAEITAGTACSLRKIKRILMITITFYRIILTPESEFISEGKIKKHSENGNVFGVFDGSI